ncbi:cell wall hydrolase [Sphingomicrobium lutaoense]|uniref:Spore germination cell wall hydrolase CwlJ-like protein n=1 Tax=Sphingomicrobium lutaoense TaxID=515949 RepID=A0A839Z6A5_9SPHN|nr:cell wall hydrolase [Sphingomicrobium lutaoense]MBB3764244.1 spore germination cell wall hydrolase CwlJ-like protein [Sphingomicrobium lutaoense]
MFAVTAGESGAMAQTMQNIPMVQAMFDRQEIAEEIIEESLEDEQPATLPELVEEYKTGEKLDEEGRCLANAVYFEARGESLEGQLAVADVVLNRAASNKYPSSWCDVVKQRAQFSFVQNRRFPRITENKAWETAKAVARIAMDDAHEIVPSDVLWYHADYVAPSWGKRLSKVAKVGVHIFYRA